MVEVVAFGVIILDDIIFPDGTTRMGVLGGGGPQAAWGMAAALGGGERVGLVAYAGLDLGPAVLAPLRTARINLAGVRFNDLPTARAWQVMEFDGRRTQVWRVDSTVLRTQLQRSLDMLPGDYTNALGFHWGIHPDEDDLSLADALRAMGKRVSLESYTHVNTPLPPERLREVVSAGELFSANWLEITRMTGSSDYPTVLARLRDAGAAVFALHRGEAGSDVWDLRVGQGVRVPAVPARVVDTVGAGNAYCGALLARLDDGLLVAAAHASAAASYLVEQVGLPPRLPDADDYRRRLNYALDRAQTLTPDAPV